MEQATRTTGLRRAGIALCLGALIVSIVWLAWPREHLLTDGAHPVMQVAPREYWCWLSNDQLMVTTVDREGGMEKPDGWQGHEDLFERNTRRRIPLPGLTTLLLRVSPLGAPYSFEMSPNHTWLVWNNYVTGDHYPFPAAAHFDGTHYREWGRDKAEVSFFLNDGHYVQETGDDAFSVIVRDLQSPRKDKRYPHTVPEAKVLIASRSARHPYYIERDLQAETDESVALSVYRAEDAQRIMFDYRYPKLKPPVPLHKNIVKLPQGSSLVDWDISPQQDLVLYHLRVERKSPVLVLLQRVFPKFVVKPVVTEEIWVNRLGESRMHEIGHVPVPAASADESKYLGFDSDSPQDELKNVQWLPDGKQISFIYRGTLYLVSAESGKP
jgi:hypothetical protein